ncbi:hypothetical protein Tco_0989399 [Tanacetum coccineum]|uniref:Uncharacterized protein n=1 Tax=Tanacetum coccineum TaxID=301880 RepID=A0ABQ5EUN7_9ASTR
MIAEHSSLSLIEEAAFLSFSLCESRLKESAHPRHPFSASLIWMEKIDWMFWKAVAGRGGAGKGGSCVLIPDLVVMAKVGASGFGVSLFHYAAFPLREKWKNLNLDVSFVAPSTFNDSFGLFGWNGDWILETGGCEARMFMQGLGKGWQFKPGVVGRRYFIIKEVSSDNSKRFVLM